MSDMKCPFCQDYLIPCIKNQNDWIYHCDNQKCPMYDDADIEDAKHPLASKDLWQELIRTRKALGVAVDALKRIDETRSGVKENLHATNGRTLNAGNGFCWTTIDDIHNDLAEITALEQKDKQ